jgi:acyl-CoA dehydrogenase
MDFSLSPELKLLVATARRFVESELLPLEASIAATGRLAPDIARRIFEKSRALGLYATNVPTEYGGGGLSTVEVCLLEEQFGHASDILVRRAFGNVYEVLLAGTAEQKRRWLVPTVAGERTCSVAFTEPEAGSDAAAIKTRAVKQGDGWRLNGYKHFISDAEFSDFFVVTATTDPAARAKGISLFIVEKGMPGFRVGRDQPMMGLAGTSHCELFFDDVALGPEHLLGPIGQGLKLALDTLGRIRLAQIGARSIGRSCRLLRLMTEHARERRQFGQPIGEFQMIGQMLADSAVEIEAGRLLLLRAAAAVDRGEPVRERISMVKLFTSETLGRVADRAVQIFGGMGYCRDLPVERMYRDARVYRIFDGTSEIHRNVIVRALLKDGVSLIDPVL